MSSLMIVSITDCGKLFETMLTNIWLFTSMDSLMDLEVASLIKDLVTKDLFAVFITNDFSADELLFVLLALLARPLSLFFPFVNALSFIDRKILL
jgi:hypothetical protein